MNEDIIQQNDVTIVTYEVTDSDLNVYRQTGSYDEGKANPFELETTDDNSVNTNNSNTNTNTNTNVNNEQSTNVNQNSTGTFFNDEGIK